MPKASPSSSTKISGFFQNSIFLFLHMICVVLGASFYFAFSFILFSCSNKWLVPSILCLERNTLRFHCLEHSSFHSFCSVSVQFLLVLRLALVFHSNFVQSLLVCFSYVLLALWSFMNICYEIFFK